MHCTCTCCASLLIRGRLTQQRGIAPFRQPPSTQQRSCISPANVLYNEIKQSIADSKIQCTKVTFDIFIRKWESVQKIVRFHLNIPESASWSELALKSHHLLLVARYTPAKNFITIRRQISWVILRTERQTVDIIFFTHWESLSAAYKELISLSICPAVTIRAVVSAPWSLSIRAWLVIVYCICILCMHVCQC